MGSAFLLNTKTVKHINRFMEYLSSLQEAGRDVHFSYAGHVDSLQVTVAVSPDKYTDVYYNPNYPTLQLYRDYSDDEWEELIDGLIEDIERATSIQLQKEKDLKELERLKGLYEPEKEKEDEPKAEPFPED